MRALAQQQSRELACGSRDTFSSCLSRHKSEKLHSDHREQNNGNRGVGLEGSLRDGSGKWRLSVESSRDIVAMSLLSSPTGHLTNLSTAPDNETDGTRRITLFPAPSDPNGRQGFARVSNRSKMAGSVTILAFDDTDRDYESLTLAIHANEKKHFNSYDLEMGNSGKGAHQKHRCGRRGLAARGDKRSRNRRAFVRPDAGRLPDRDARHGAARRHAAPGGCLQPRVKCQPGERPTAGQCGRGCGRGDRCGNRRRRRDLGLSVLSVPPGTSRSLSAEELETGGAGFDGMLGDGAGKWQLDIGSTRPITVMSLLSSTTGHLMNLSTAPAADSAPAGDAMFRDRFLGGWVGARDPESRVRFHAAGRFSMTDGTGNREGGYTYTRAGGNRAGFVLNFDDGNRCTYRLAFASRLAGRHTYACDDGKSGEIWANSSGSQKRHTCAGMTASSATSAILATNRTRRSRSAGSARAAAHRFRFDLVDTGSARRHSQ